MTQDNSKLRYDFEVAATRISKELVLDYKDVKGAYESKPESLTVLFNGREESLRKRNWNIFWTAIAGLMFWPLTPVPLYFAYNRQKQVEQADETVKGEVARYRAALPPPSPPAIG